MLGFIGRYAAMPGLEHQPILKGRRFSSVLVWIAMEGIWTFLIVQGLFFFLFFGLS